MSGPAPARTGPPDREQLDHLRLLDRVAAAADRHASLVEAGRVVLEEVCRYTGWPVGRLSIVDPAAGAVVPAEAWMANDGPRLEGLDGSALARRVFDTGRPAWSEGPAAGVGVPVLVAERPVAVLELFSEDPAPRDEGLVNLLSGVAHHLARVEERARALAGLRQVEERYRALTETVPDAIVTADPTGLVLTFNRGAERMFGLSAEDVEGRSLLALVPARFRDACEAGMARVREGGEPAAVGRATEVAGLRRDGSEFPVELTLSSWDEPSGRFLTAVIRDITERRQAELDRKAFERQLAQQALRDPLTDLPSRALFLDRVEHALARGVRRETRPALVSVNVDHFRAVNETYGHRIGDQLLLAVAGRLQQLVRPEDTLARVGSDEFAVLCEDVASPADALVIAERITHGLARLFVIEGQAVTISVSAGVAVAADTEVEPDRLLREAGAALERAREQGRGRAALYQGSAPGDGRDRPAPAHELRLAIGQGQLRLYYQPIVDLASGLIKGVESLVRWEHPSQGLLAPNHFIGLAEETGLIVPLGGWVLAEACRQGAAWQRDFDGAGGLRVAVNVSARQFQRPEWTDEVAETLLATGFDPTLLVLEITESLLMEDTETTTRRLSALRALGVRIAIDDFGTGYSSLGYLRRFPVDILKVDKSFIEDVADGPHESALARAVIKLAASLGLDAVAEGVSNRRQLATLRRLRCRYGQGFYFSRPQPAEALDALIARPALGADVVEGAADVG